MADKLSVFNDALLIIEEGPLSSTEENNKSGRALRAMYETSVSACLEKGAWNHGVTRVQLARLEEEPAFHYDYFYAKPGDCARILSCHDQGNDRDGFMDWRDEDGKIATGATTIYMRYVSNTTLELVGRWPQTFADYVAGDLAMRIGAHIKGSGWDYAKALKELDRREGNAMAFDVSQQPPKRWNPGRWARAHRAYGSITGWGRDGRG